MTSAPLLTSLNPLTTDTHCFRRAAVLLCLLGAPVVAGAAVSVPGPSSPTVAGVAPLSLSDVGTEAVATLDSLREIDTDLSDDPLLKAIRGEWPSFTKELNGQLSESSRLIRSHPSLDNLDHQERVLVRLTNTLDEWNRGLASRVKQMDGKLAQIERSQATWNLTLESAQTPETPVDVLENIRHSLAALRTAAASLRSAERDVLSLQNLITQDDRRLDSSVDALNQAEEQILDRVLKRDSPPIWSERVSQPRPGAALISKEGKSSGGVQRTDTASEMDSLDTELSALVAYARRNGGLFLLHAALTLFFLLAAAWSRGLFRRVLVTEPALESAAAIMNSPASVAIAMAMVAAIWIYPAPPRLMKVMLIAVALVPAALVLRRLVGRDFRPVPTMLLLFFFADHLRGLLSGSALMSRGALLVETAAAVAGALWTWRRLHARAPNGRFKIRRRGLTAATRLAALALAIALGANVLGFLNLATLLANATLNSAYFAVLLFAALRVASMLTLVVLRVPPIGRLRVSRLHRRAVWRAVLYVLEWAAFIAWLVYTLERLAIADLVWQSAVKVFNTPLSVGSISLTLGNIAAFAVTLWVAVTLSSLARFLLEEEVYSHFALPAGLPYAISRTLHYVILFGGFLTAVAALGFDMTKFTILVSAFGVGLGFGMQNIFNNFASGLILLFERPVKVGDVIQIDDATGVIERIGIRATVMRTGNGTRVIYPNGKLVSDRVTNWTSGGRQRIVQIPVSVPAGTDPQRVVALLKTVAARDPRIAKDPPPRAVAINLGAGGFDFELRVWTADIENVIQVKSDIAVAFNDEIRHHTVPA